MGGPKGTKWHQTARTHSNDAFRDEVISYFLDNHNAYGKLVGNPYPKWAFIGVMLETQLLKDTDSELGIGIFADSDRPGVMMSIPWAYHKLVSVI